MRRVFIYILLLCCASMTTGCVTEGVEGRDSDVLMRAIWREAQSDIVSLCQNLAEVDNMDRVLAVVDTDERAQQFVLLFPNSTLAQEGSSYVVTTPTGYGTTFKTTFVTDGKRLSEGGHWRVERTGGSGYTLELIPLSEGGHRAKFTSLNINESQGSAEFDIEFGDTEDLAMRVLRYNRGCLIMVDGQGSESKPLTLTTLIKEPVLCVNLTNSSSPKANMLVSGTVDIECYDALYNATDRIGVRIDDGVPTIKYISGGMVR